jgi:hypothetical protein
VERPLSLGRNPRSISDHLGAELAPASITRNEHSGVPMNNFGNHMLVRRVSGDSIRELPEPEAHSCAGGYLPALLFRRVDLGAGVSLGDSSSGRLSATTLSISCRILARFCCIVPRSLCFSA